MIDMAGWLRLILVLAVLVFIPALWLVCWLLDRFAAWRNRRVHRWPRSVGPAWLRLRHGAPTSPARPWAGAAEHDPVAPAPRGSHA